jgi:S1-C subfamily serine protease
LIKAKSAWFAIVSFALCAVFLCSPFHATLIPPPFLDAVVLIGRTEINPAEPIHWVPEASGFLYGDYLKKVDEQHNSYQVFLVTNRHVIEDHAVMTNRPLSVKFNLKTQGSTRAYDIPLRDNKGNPVWHFHPDATVDLAVVSIDTNVLEKEGAVFYYFHSDADVLSRAKAKELGLSEGDGVFVLGYPMGIAGSIQDYVIVRQGAIARVRDSLEVPTLTSFLVDSFVFPGSSGGPVVLKPELVSLQNAKPAIQNSYLLGVVRGYIPYTDVAISAQTKHPRVTFEENSGLTEVIPADFIKETIEDLRKSKP